ncbi:MAG: PAS domain-containing protein, partial [Acidobacteriia bacterium]|nr:PAS domain-containing protein [Terriglobia bacterium]
MATAIVPNLLQFEKAIPRLLNASRGRVLAVTAATITAIALADWRVGTLSLGGIYIFPMLLAATILPSRAIIALAVGCAVLRCSFDNSHFAIEYALRFTFSFLSYVASGLFVVAVMRNRRMALDHVEQITQEQRLRNEAQERLKTLVASSPAAILTLNFEGTVIAANHAANDMFGVSGEMEGRSIKPYLPMLAEALRLGTAGKPFRTAAQAQGRKQNGEIFLADLWFSTYANGEGTQLAAIVVDSSEELRDREQENLR